MMLTAATTALAAVKPLTPQEADEIVKLIDDRQRNTGDYKSLCYVKESVKNKEPQLYQVIVYRRDADDKFMMLFTKPKQEAGKGYLKIDKNLWLYDPGTGKWERRTAREKILGTNSRQADFDESNLATDYTAKFMGSSKIGEFEVYNIKLTAKKDLDVAYPVLDLAVDVNTKNVLKREEYSLSGKLMRTTFFPKWTKQFSKSKNDHVWVPSEMRVFDELEKGNSTIILVKETSLDALEANIFTKAWLEAKSR
jgi:hypothetical protein